MAPPPVLLPGKTHGLRSLVGCSPWGCEESDTTEWLPFHFSLSGIGEGNGNPLKCSCLENHRDGGAWWASIYGIAQGWTRLKRLSSSSRNSWVSLIFLIFEQEGLWKLSYPCPAIVHWLCEWQITCLYFTSLHIKNCFEGAILESQGWSLICICIWLDDEVLDLRSETLCHNRWKFGRLLRKDGFI